jgi:3-hydroxybutyryl-CoA dehydrogenase
MIEVKRVSVIGLGVMGSGISEVMARSGMEVYAVDVNDECIRRGLDRIKQSMGKALERGKITKDEYEGSLSRIKTTTSLKEAVKDIDLVIECVPENMELKKALFREVEMLCPQHAIISSNTSSLSITSLASALKRQDRFVGFHFFNPAPIMKLVEVIRGANTSDETVETVVKVAERCGKVPVVVNDAPGFVSTRMHAAFVLEAMRILQEGVATAKAIDDIAKLGYNHPMGPLELADLMGLDVVLDIYEYLAQEYGERFKPPSILKKLVNAGHLGRKTGKGFYTYKR